VGDPKSSLVERLFAEHRGALQSFIRRRIRRAADAADLAQEVYLRLLRLRDEDSIRNPVPYLYTVASNIVKEHALLERQRASRLAHEARVTHEELESLPSFDGQLDDARRSARLREVLLQLRPKCQAAVMLRFAHGLTNREVAARLEISPQMVKKYIAQALAHCRRRMTRMG
jgi:RNA polymerase sigma-70 factor (ECF subfamily)